MADSDLQIKILNVADGIKIAAGFPSLSYTEEFFKYREKAYRLFGGFLAVYKKNDLILLVPANYSKDSFYSVYKDYTEPLIKGEFNKTMFPIIINKLKREHNFKRLEFSFGFINNNSPPFFSDFFSDLSLSIFVLKLGDKEDRNSLFSQFKKKTRNEIRKAEKSGLNVDIGEVREIDEIYKLYAVNMKRHGTPLKSKDYFKNLFDCYKERCKVISAYDKNYLAGVNIAFIKDNYLRLQYNYSDSKYWPDCVNDLLYYKMIEWGYGQGINIFDFGPSSNDDKSNIHFKLGFGAVQTPLFKKIERDKISLLKDWLEQKSYNFKIRFNKFKNKL